METTKKLEMLEALEEEISNHLMNEKREYSIFGNIDDEIHYIIEGWTYSVNVYINSDLTIDLYTTHKDRFKTALQDSNYWNKEDKSDANRKTVKTLKAVINYVDKWLEK
jgi:hypothetical protein